MRRGLPGRLHPPDPGRARTTTTSEMLYIDPEECIDCDACVEACPVDAIFAEDQLPEEWQHYAEINADYYANSWLSAGRRRPRGRRAREAPAQAIGSDMPDRASAPPPATASA